MDGQNVQTQQAQAMKVTTHEATILKTILSNLANFRDEGKIIFEKGKGMYANVTDPALISVVRVYLSRWVFDQFDVEKEEISVSFEKLKEIFRQVKKDNKISMYKNGSNFIIEVDADVKRKYSLPMLSLEEEYFPNLDEFTFKAKAVVESKALKKIISEARRLLVESLVIYSNGKVLKLTADETKDFEVEMEIGSMPLMELDVKEESKAIYRVDYLEKAVKFADISQHAVLEWSSNNILKLTFYEGLLENPYFKVEVAVAPQVIE